MPEEAEQSGKPDIPRNAVIEHLLVAETVEIDPLDERICALLPASIEALQRMIETGMFVDRSGVLKDYTNNSLGVIATPALVPKLVDMPSNEEFARLLYEPGEALSYAQIEAENTARAHYFIDQFGLSLDDRVLHEAVDAYIFAIDPETHDFNRLIGGGAPIAGERDSIETSAELLPLLPDGSLDRVSAIATAARTREGFLIGIASRSIRNPAFQLHGIAPGTDYNLEISFGPNGMPYSAIAAIQPLGPQEENFLKILEEARKEALNNL